MANYSAFQNVLHKIFTNFQLPCIKSTQSNRYLNYISFESLRSVLSFSITFLFISGHHWSADTKQKKWTLFSRAIFSVTIEDIKMWFATLGRSCDKLSNDINIIKIERSVATRLQVEKLCKHSFDQPIWPSIKSSSKVVYNLGRCQCACAFSPAMNRILMMCHCRRLDNPGARDLLSNSFCLLLQYEHTRSESL